MCIILVWQRCKTVFGETYLQHVWLPHHSSRDSFPVACSCHMCYKSTGLFSTWINFWFCSVLLIYMSVCILMPCYCSYSTFIVWFALKVDILKSLTMCLYICIIFAQHLSNSGPCSASILGLLFWFCEFYVVCILVGIEFNMLIIFG